MIPEKVSKPSLSEFQFEGDLLKIKNPFNRSLYLSSTWWIVAKTRKQKYNTTRNAAIFPLKFRNFHKWLILCNLRYTTSFINDYQVTAGLGFCVMSISFLINFHVFYLMYSKSGLFLQN